MEKGPVSDSRSPSPPSEADPSKLKALIRKLDLRLLPAVSVLYLLSFLDRSNVANARIEGLTDDLNMSGDQYLTGLTLFFIGYVLFEIPSNIALKRTSPRIWLPLITLAWGVVSTLMGITQSLAGFYVVRFVLGATECGLFPGVVYYLSMWYRRNDRQFRVALFFSAASLAGAFGGILAYGIAFMRGVGGLAGWRWIFIIEGLLTAVVAATAFFFIQNYPDTATFLTDDERTTIQAALRADSDATRDESFTWTNVSKALLDPKCWLYGLCFHTMSLPLYTLSLFLPTIIKELGFTAAQAQLLSVPPYAIATTLTVVIAITSQRLNLRAPFILCTSSLAVIGYIILLSDPRPWPSYGGTILAAAGIYPSCALVLAWPANNVSGQTKRAVSNAMQISIGNLGAVIGTQLYRTESAPRFFVGHGVACGYLVGNLLVVSTTWAVLSRENRKRDRLAGQTEQGQTQSEGEWKGDEDPSWRFQT